jgi:CHAD domain-containing protein
MAISNLASTYSKLGMHRDALVLHQQVLALYRRVLPEDHPYIGVTRFC